ncbi:MAG: ATP-dependent DNA helicase RecG [Chloroflexota bacterium]|nr:ATP-dependent DNA helicase RecG [Chloroflexota bacterium]
MTRAVAGPRVAQPEDLDRPLRDVMPELGRTIRVLGALGLRTPRDVLFHLPRRYDDFSELRPLGELIDGEKQSSVVTVGTVRVEKGYGRRPQRVVATLHDRTGSADAVWFGRRFIERRLRPDDTILVSGKVNVRGWRPEFVGPEFAPEGADSLHAGRVTPVYPLVAGITNRRLRELMARVLDRWLPAVPDPLTDAERGELPPLAVALREAHFPDTADAVWPALDRLAFDELLALQLTLAQIRVERDRTPGKAVVVPPAERERLISALPFVLTGDQRRALDAVLDDVGTARPMRRMLQGDVGSGKTAVAALALAAVSRAGWQGALMAPTEILARQHYAGLLPLLDLLGVRAEFLSGALTSARKREIHGRLARGEADVVVGTHAVISETVALPRLALAVVDEQHRFGVGQRAALEAKASGHAPHVLALTATPIPRTLALTFYGDLDISSLRELPPGRHPIRTEIRDRRALPRIESFLAEEARGGRQSFVVVPLVHESDALTAASAEAEAERLAAALPYVRIGLVHGQQPTDERDRVMQRFAAREIDVLVATTVIEVGIDVPNASVMLIEDADRFGLAQLHQLRGRVGRGPHRSFCILVSDADDELARRRLEVIRGSSDGFAISEADLALRGAGNLLGTRQSGLPPLRVASLFDRRHVALAERARALADRIVARDPALAGRPELARLRETFAPLEAEGDAA